MEKKTIKTGILGAGFMGRTHARNLIKTGGAEIAAICDADENAAAELNASEAGGGAKVYTDFDVMTEKQALDALYICLPPFAHNGQAEKAAEKGWHLFLEKPLALTRERGLSMARAAENAGIVTQMGYHFRFSPAVRKLKKMIGDGSAGLPTLFEGRYFCNSTHSPWWRDVKRSGGQLFEQCIHVYDLALHLLGRPAAASGFQENICHRETEGYTAEDTSAAAARFQSGALASVAASNCAVPMTWELSFNVICENITARFRSGTEAEFIRTDLDPPASEMLKEDADLYLLETQNFINAVLGKEQPLAPIQDGLLGLNLVSAVVESARSGGQMVSLE